MGAQADLNSTLTWFLSSKSSLLDEQGEWSVSMLARTIAHSYTSISQVDYPLVTSTLAIDELAMSSDLRDYEYLAPVRSLSQFAKLNLDKYVLDFLVHGSLASGDYVKGWSDFDTLVIVKSETIANSDLLSEFRGLMIEAERFLFQLDPLQHHGFIYCTERDLTQFLSHCLPVAVLEESKSFLKASELTVSHYRSRSQARKFFQSKVAMFRSAHESGVLKHHRYSGKYLKEDFADLDTMYQMKYFLAVLMSLPVLYLDAIGESCFKKFSFEIVKADFLSAWEIIDKASEIRMLWCNQESYPYSGNQIPQWLVSKLGPGYFSRAFKLADAMWVKLADFDITD